MWFLSFICMYFFIQSFNKLLVSICCVLEMHRRLRSLLLRSSVHSKRDRKDECCSRGKHRTCRNLIQPSDVKEGFLEDMAHRELKDE